MDRVEQLRILHRHCGGNARKVALQHIFNGREQIEPADHAYLDEHIDELSLDEHAWRLAHAPDQPQRLIERIVAALPPAEAGTEPPRFILFNTIAQCARWFDPDVLEELVDRLQPPRLHADEWWAIARQMKGMCPPYVQLQKTDGANLGHALYAYRRDEIGLLQALPGAVRALDETVHLHRFKEARDAGLLVHVRPADVLPAVIRLEGEEGSTFIDSSFIEMVLDWPEAHGWYFDQLVAAAARGARQDILWNATPTAERVRLAFTAQDAGCVVCWLGASIRDALYRREPDAWDRLFRYIDAPGALNPQPTPVSFVRTHWKMQAPEEEAKEQVPKLDELSQERPGRAAVQMLLDAPLPEEAGDEFEQLLLRYRALIGKHVPAPFGPDYLLFRRIAQLPLTKERASRLLRWALRQPSVWHSASELKDIALTADPLSPDELPAAERFLEGDYDTEGVVIYRCIGGAAAETRLRAWLREPLSWKAEEMSEKSSFRAPLNVALSRARSVPDLISDDLRVLLKAAARKEPMGVMLGHFGRAEMPWLVDKETLVQEALARATVERERWVFGDAPKLPTSLLPAVRLRVRSNAPVDDELVSLLRWLQAQGEPLGELITVVTERLRERERGFSHYILAWVVEALSSRTRWAHHGCDIFLALLDAEAWDAIEELVRRVLPWRADSEKIDKKEQHRLVLAMHDALGRALIRVADRAIDQGAMDDAIGALHGLAALRPRTGLRGPLHHLSKKPNLTEELAELVALNVGLLRRDATREATRFDLSSALSLVRERRLQAGSIAKSA